MIGVEIFFDLILGVMSVVGVIGVIVGDGLEDRMSFFLGLFKDIFFVVFRCELNKEIKEIIVYGNSRNTKDIFISFKRIVIFKLLL